MKHVTFSDRSLLMGDQAADTLLEYARLIADARHADSVTLNAISPDGNTVEASFLLNSNTVLVIESTNSATVAPNNDEAVKAMQAQIDSLSQPISSQGEPPWAASIDEFSAGDGLPWR
ncbi:hypothetical protein LG299_00265 [Microbacterium lacus]|uniref:hypothetical protein n=1 Tax=Microbacterium lacus TaxID=415217 RepID=UPI00384F6D5D